MMSMRKKAVDHQAKRATSSRFYLATQVGRNNDRGADSWGDELNYLSRNPRHGNKAPIAH